MVDDLQGNLQVGAGSPRAYHADKNVGFSRSTGGQAGGQASGQAGGQGSALTGLLGDSIVMQQVRTELQQLASTPANVLISGEAGTGKGLAARSLQALSCGADAPCVLVDCSGGWSAVFEALAALATPGVGARGDNGSSRRLTLIVRGISDLTPSAQADLVQGLAGASNGAGNGRVASPARMIVIAEGNAALASAQGLLHADVQQRLAPLSLAMPALRERDEDVELLAQYFLAVLNSEEGTSKRFSGEALIAMREYPWPGNVRELRRAVQHSFVLSDQELQFSPAVRKPAASDDEPALRIPVGTCLDDAERWMIAATLKKCGGNKTRAAALLGVSLKTLYNRLNAYRAQGLELSSVDRELAEVGS